MRTSVLVAQKFSILEIVYVLMTLHPLHISIYRVDCATLLLVHLTPAYFRLIHCVYFPFTLFCCEVEASE